MQTNRAFWELADRLILENGISIDRPKGSRHPRYQDFIYPLDYGFVNNTASPDGAGIDVWVGSSGSRQVSAIICSIDIMKRDSEIKMLYSCTPAEIELIYREHNRSEGMKGILVLRQDEG